MGQQLSGTASSASTAKSNSKPISTVDDKDKTKKPPSVSAVTAISNMWGTSTTQKSSSTSKATMKPPSINEKKEESKTTSNNSPKQKSEKEPVYENLSSLQG